MRPMCGIARVPTLCLERNQQNMADAKALSNAIANTVDKLGASLVRVDARARGGTTATVWNADGVLITAHHGIERDDDITVTLPDGTQAPATLAGRDAGTDIAVLRVDRKGLTPPTWAGTDGVRVGNL